MGKGGDNEEDGTVVRNTYVLCVGWCAAIESVSGTTR